MTPSLEQAFLHVVEQAAIACSHTMGQGDRKHSDRVAVEAMRMAMDALEMDGRIVIGEGERDKAPMLYVGERLGLGKNGNLGFPSIDIAVDPLEGTNLCATGSPNAIAVLAASEKGGLLYAPDIYMEKIVVGPTARGSIDIDAPVADNLKNIAKAFDRQISDLTIIVLDRDRHQKLIADIRTAGARIKLITDGDLSAGIAAAVRGTGVQALMGTGGAPEGVLTAAAIRCLNGQMLARLAPLEQWHFDRLNEMGFTDHRKIYTEVELASGDDIIFAATGVTTGDLLKGVRFFGHGMRTSSVFMSLKSRSIRFIDSIFKSDDDNLAIAF